MSPAQIEVPASLLNAPSNANPAASGSTSATPAPTLSQEKKRKHHLSAATDPIFAELRDLNFASVGRRLNKAARRLDEDYKGPYISLQGNTTKLLFRGVTKHPYLNCVTLWGSWVAFKQSTEPCNFVSPGLTRPLTFFVKCYTYRHWIIGNNHARDTVGDFQQISRNTAKLVSGVIALGARVTHSRSRLACFLRCAWADNSRGRAHCTRGGYTTRDSTSLSREHHSWRYQR
jgi:hypothetical protein